MFIFPKKILYSLSSLAKDDLVNKYKKAYRCLKWRWNNAHHGEKEYYCRTSYAARCKPDFNWLVSSLKLSSNWSMEKSKVKLKRICTFCIRNAFWSGLVVIPPLNFTTSKKEGSPNKDGVKCRYDIRVTKETKEALIKLRVVASDSTANTTFVVFDPAGAKCIISTCHRR